MPKQLTTLLCVLFISLLSACGEDVIEEENKYVGSLVESRLKEGISFNEAKVFFAEHGYKIEIFRECEESDYEKCPYLSIGGIPLPNEHWWLGRGTAQIYMTFNQEMILTSVFYELYYPRYH